MIYFAKKHKSNKSDKWFERNFIEAFSPKKVKKPELLDIEVESWKNGRITTVQATARFKDPKPAKEIVEFHENFVRIGYKTYAIQQDYTVDVFNLGGLSYLAIDNDAISEYIYRHGQKYVIKKGAFGNKYLVEA